MKMEVEQKQLLESWRKDLNMLFNAHFKRSIKIRRINYFLGIPIIFIAITVASYVFLPSTIILVFG